MENEINLLQRLKSSDLSFSTNKKTYIHINNNLLTSIAPVKYKNHIQEIEDIVKNKSKQSKLQTYDLELRESLRKEMNDYINLISNFTSLRDKIKHLYSLIVEEILKKESLINDLLTYYSEFKLSNKNNIIRFDILNHLLKKISFSNKEKDVLLSKNPPKNNFFELLQRVLLINENVSLIQSNSNQFSKNLVLSLKENINLIRELANERIVYYLKNSFNQVKPQQIGSIESSSSNNHFPLSSNSHKENFSVEILNNIIVSIIFINDNTNYVAYIQKEYINFRKKVIEESCKFKNYKFNLSSVNLLVKILLTTNKQFEFLFLREALLMYVFFYDSKIFYKNELEKIVQMLNLDLNKTLLDVETKSNFINSNTNNQNDINNNNTNITSQISDIHTFEKCMLIHKELFSLEITDLYEYVIRFINHSQNEKDKTDNKLNKVDEKEPNTLPSSIIKKFIIGLNTVFYHFLYDLYETLNTVKSSLEETDKNFSNTFKICLILKYITLKLESMFASLKVQSSDYKNFEIFSLISNFLYKFGKSYIKILNEIGKKIVILKQNFMREIKLSTKSCDLQFLNEIKIYSAEVAKMYEMRRFFSENLDYKVIKADDNSNNEYENLDNITKALVEFFNEISINKLLNEKYVYNNSEQIMAIKIFDYYLYLDNLLKPSYSYIKDPSTKIEEKISSFQSVIEDFVVKNILVISNFEDNLIKIISQEHALLFMEKLSDTFKYLTITLLDFIFDLNVKEKMKEIISEKLLNQFKLIMKRNPDCLYILSEEDFKSIITS